MHDLDYLRELAGMRQGLDRIAGVLGRGEDYGRVARIVAAEWTPTVPAMVNLGNEPVPGVVIWNLSGSEAWVSFTTRASLLELELVVPAGAWLAVPRLCSVVSIVGPEAGGCLVGTCSATPELAGGAIREGGIPGTVLFDDTFARAWTSSPLAVTAGTGALALTATDEEWSTAGQALKFTSSTVASEACELHHFTAKPPRAGVLVGGFIFHAQDTNLSKLAFYVQWWNGSELVFGKVRYDVVNSRWEYQDAAGSQVVLLSRSLSTGSAYSRWHHLTIVVDVENRQWLGALVDDLDASDTLDGLPCSTSTSSSNGGMADLAIESTNRSGTPSASVVLLDRCYLAAFPRLPGVGGASYARRARDLIGVV